MEYSWDKLISKSGVELYKYYKDLLRLFDTYCTGRVREIYQGAMTNIDEPKNLEKIITTIDGLDWYSAREEGLGNLYEGLLEKNANEKKVRRGPLLHPSWPHGGDDPADEAPARRAVQRPCLRHLWLYDCRPPICEGAHRRFLRSGF